MLDRTLSLRDNYDNWFSKWFMTKLISFKERFDDNLDIWS